MYRVGEYVAVQDHQSEGTEWIVQFTALLVYGPVNNAYAHFFNGNYFAAKTLADGSVHKDGLSTEADQKTIQKAMHSTSAIHRAQGYVVHNRHKTQSLPLH